MNKPLYRFWGQQPPAARSRTPIVDTAAASPSVDSTTATMRIYEPIDSWGGDWGISAIEFVEALNSLPANVSNIDLRVNSPGGEAFEAIAILNALRAHPATVTVTVDGLAASAASFIAAGADVTVMAPNSQLMIHDASGMAIGQASVMTQMADILNKISDNVASIYAAKSGTADTAGWRTAMLAESWYSAQEAVDAGLADAIAETGTQPTDKFDLSMYAYQGRDAAPGPVPPIPTQRGERFTDEAGSVLTDVTALIDRATEIVALRAERGKGISEESAALLDRLDGELERLRSLTDQQSTPDSTGSPEYLAWMARRLPSVTSA